MEWIETKELPAACLSCKEGDCYNCDTAGQRWSLSAKDELLLRRKALLKAMERLQRQLAEIDREISLLSGDGPN